MSERTPNRRRPRGLGGCLPVYACRMCHKIIGNSPLKRCSSCGYSHSPGEATAIR